MEIAILGANGFVGSNLVRELGKEHKIYSITREDYRNFIGLKFDVLINANGNGRKYLAEDKPLLDFDLSVKSVYNSLSDFEFGLYIYISSNDVYTENSIYGFHKLVAENIIRQWSGKKQFDYVNLRCGAVIGPGMKKGVLYDIINDIPLHISSKSELQFISIKEITGAILYILNNGGYYGINLDVFSPQNISIKKIEKIIGKKAKYSLGELPLQYYNRRYGSNLLKTYKSSSYYIREYIKC
jgi:nucleoside-diphosphate-sugar epimerase